MDEFEIQEVNFSNTVKIRKSNIQKILLYLEHHIKHITIT